MSKTKGRCTTRSMWIPDPVSGELCKRDLGSTKVWAEHPVSGALVRIRSWKDVRDLDRAGRRSGVDWEHLVVAADGDMSDAEVRASLAGSGPTPVVYLDEDSARGRRRIEVTGPEIGDVGDAGGSSRASAASSRVSQRAAGQVRWVADLAENQRELRQIGAGKVAHELFGAKTRRDIVAGVGAAMLDRGPSGRLGNRAQMVALAAAASEWLSADQIADMLGWPVSGEKLSEQGALALGTVLARLPESRRFVFLEAVASGVGSASGGQNRDYDYDYDDNYRDPWVDSDAYRRAWWGDLPEDVSFYLHDASRLLASVGDGSLAISDSGEVRGPSSGSLNDWLTFAAVAAELYSDNVGELPKFTGDVSAYATALMGEMFPGVNAYTWDDRLRSALGAQVPGLDGSAVTLPTSPAELEMWGQQMSNCIGGYGSTVAGGEPVGAVTVDGRVAVNFTLRRSSIGWYVGEVAGKFNRVNSHEVHMVREHLEQVVGQLPLAPLGTSVMKAPSLPGGHQLAAAALSPSERTTAERWDEWMDDRVAPRTRRVGGGRRRQRREAPAPRPVEVFGRIASDPDLSLVANAAVRELPEQDRAAFTFALTPTRSIADVVRVAATVSPTDAWIAPDVSAGVADLLGELGTLSASEIEQRWAGLTPFAHAPSVDDAVRSAVIATADGTLSDRLVAHLDARGEWLMRESLPVAQRPGFFDTPRVFNAAWRRAGLGRRSPAATRSAQW